MSDIERTVWFADGGEMRALILAHDWSATPLGPADRWPRSLTTIVSMLAATGFPMIALWGPDLIQIYNDGYREVMGTRHPQGLGQPTFQCWPDVAHINEPIYARVLAGETLNFEDALYPIKRDGRIEKAFFTLSYSPLRNDGGSVAGVLVTVVETTGRVKAEARLRDSEQRLSQMFEQAPTFMALLREPNHTFERVNPGYTRLVGRDVVGRTVAEVLPEAVEQGYLDLLDEVYRSGKAFAANGSKIAIQTMSGGPVDERYIDFVYQPIKDARGEVTGIFVEGADVTERTLAERALRESKALLLDANTMLERLVEERTQERDRIWQVSRDMLGIADSAGIWLSVNPAWTRILGWDANRIVGQSSEWMEHPDDREKTRAEVRRLAGGQATLAFENRFQAIDGSYRHLSWTAVPADGLLYCVTRDVTEEKERAAALAQAEEALRQSQKMEAVGQLTGGLAHDFNNLLTGITGSLELLQIRIAQGRIKDVDRYVNAAQGAAKRAAALTHRLLAFSRRQTLAPKPTDVNRLIAGMEDLVRRTAGPEIAVEVVASGGLWNTLVDPGQLENALLNLCINARDAMPDGGKLTIETANRWLDERAARARDLPSGQYVSLCVSDTGAGMPSDVIARAFDPFFTTKPIGMGTGLGLSMIYGFVRQSGGQARIYSEVGQGTMVCLYLPRYLGDADAAELPAKFGDAPRAGHDETVLIIDDEPTVRMLVTDILEDLGYTAIEAADGVAGLKVLQSDVRIDLLVTDVGLPGGINGRQVADAARLVRPSLKVLFITGYAENAMLSHGHLDPGMHVLTKPFAMEVLASRIKTLIVGN